MKRRICGRVDHGHVNLLCLLCHLAQKMITCPLVNKNTKGRKMRLKDELNLCLRLRDTRVGKRIGVVIFLKEATFSLTAWVLTDLEKITAGICGSKRVRRRMSTGPPSILLTKSVWAARSISSFGSLGRFHALNAQQILGRKHQTTQVHLMYCQQQRCVSQ